MSCVLSCRWMFQETTIEELKHQFMKQQDAKGFIVDGFPREIAQAFTFEEQVRVSLSKQSTAPQRTDEQSA